MFVWVRLPGSFDSSELLQRAIAHDVAFVPGAPFFAQAPDLATLRLSFTNQPHDAIIHGMDRLAQVFTSQPSALVARPTTASPRLRPCVNRDASV